MPWPFRKGKPVLKIDLKVGADHFKLEADVTLADLTPHLDKWYGSLAAGAQREIDKLTAQIKKDNDDLAGAVAGAHT